MHCRSCGADLPADAAYCSQCGGRVELGSVLGVGTDLNETRGLPLVAPATGAAPAAQHPPTPRPHHAESGAAFTSDDPAEPDRGPAHSRSSIVAMIATFAVLTIIGTFALTRLVGSDEPGQAGQSTSSASSPVEESGDPAPAPSTAAASPSGTPSPSDTPSAEVSTSAAASIPAEARRCSTSGSDAVATAHAGTERTSCEFAASVRDAYRKAGTPGGPTSLRAYSPVTKKWYSLSCDGGEPVRCTSTTNAIVLLSP